MLGATEVEQLAAQVIIRIYARDDTVWTQGENPRNEVGFLARGRVEYIWKVDDREEMVGVRDEGDVLGLTAFIEGEPYRVTAHVVEESLVYALPWNILQPLLEANDAARHYVRRHLFWATRVGGNVTLPSTKASIARPESNILEAHLVGARKIEMRPLNRLLTCSPEANIEEAATLMSTKRVPSILVVNQDRHPLGILSGSALIKRIIVDDHPKSDPVSQHMATPVHTIGPDESATTAILLMLRQRIGQICITEDGTPNSPALDVVTHKDLLTQSGHHPAGLLREIRLARSPARFKEMADDIEHLVYGYLKAGASSIFMGQICAEFYDAMVERLIELTILELEKEHQPVPDHPWAWIAVGSDGRREQILRTDMDNGFIFQSTGDAESDETLRQAFLRLTNKVVQRLVDAGFSRCQGGVMASNPRWCRSTLEWEEEIRALTGFSDGVAMLRGITLFDMRFVAGHPELASDLRTLIFDHVDKQPTLLRKMAEYAVESPPPLNFWGKFIVEKKGIQEGRFDIKARGMSPIRDAARVLSFKYRITHYYSTGNRLDEIGARAQSLSEVAAYGREAYELLMRLRTVNGFAQKDSGRFINPENLSKLERAQLANAFDIQRLLQTSLRAEFCLEQRPA